MPARTLTFCLLVIALILCLFSCEKPSNEIVPPTPDPTPTPAPSPEPEPEPLSGTLCTDIGQTPVILAYYTEYSSALPDVTLLTHINYAHGRFANPSTGEGGIVISKPELMEDVIKLKSKNPKLKVLLMIGGWGIKADGFSMMACNSGKRTAFCKSVQSLLDKYGLDGVDIDWEYPTYSAEGTGARSDDTANFNLVLKELRKTIGTYKIISFASSSSAKYVDWPEAIKYIDYVNVMTYDMGSAPDGHNSPLYHSSIFDHRSCDESIELHRQKGIPLERMNLGVPFYGRAESNPAVKVYESEVCFNEMASILEKNYYAKRKLDVKGKNIRKWDEKARVPYLTDTGGHILLCYDDAESVTAKGEFVKEKKLLGAMFWEYRHDDSNQTLLKALVKSIYGKESVL